MIKEKGTYCMLYVKKSIQNCNCFKKECSKHKKSPKMIKECCTKVLMVEIKRTRFKLSIIFGWKIDNNENNEK